MKGDKLMMDPCYLVKKGAYEEIENGTIVCKTEKCVAQNLRMPANGRLIWVTENLAKNIKKNSNRDLNVIPTIKTIYIMQKSWNEIGHIKGYINLDEYYKLDKNSLKNYEKGIYIYPVDYFSALEFTTEYLNKNKSSQKAEEIIDALHKIPLKGNKLDFKTFEENNQPGM